MPSSTPTPSTAPVVSKVPTPVPTHSITYVLDGGSNASSNPSSYKEGEGVASFAAASKDGFTFEGWFDAPSTSKNAAKITSISSTATTDYTLYAVWSKEKVTHKISYTYNGEHVTLTGSLSPTTYTEGTETALPSTSVFTPIAGYKINGWVISGGAASIPISSIPSTATSDYDIALSTSLIKYYIILTSEDGADLGTVEVTYGSGQEVNIGNAWDISGYSIIKAGQDISTLTTSDGARLNATVLGYAQ